MHDFYPDAEPQEHPPENEVQLMIGKVASLYDITVQTLRHYDKIGLFRPEVINPDTGYRYYSLRQLRQLEHILFLRRMDFSLTEIEEAMECFRLGGSMQEVLEQHRTQLEQRIRSLQQLQERLSLLAELGKQENGPLNCVSIYRFEEPRYLRCREIAPLPVSDPEFGLRLLEERRALLGSIPTIQSEYSMGAMVDAEAYLHTGQLCYCSILLDPGFYGTRPMEGMEAVQPGYYAAIRFHRSQTRPEEAYDTLLAFVEEHRFRHDARILELSLDPTFSSISRVGELTELQLRLILD